MIARLTVTDRRVPSDPFAPPRREATGRLSGATPDTYIYIYIYIERERESEIER